MLHPIDGYSEREASELVGKRVTQIDTSKNAANADPRKGTIIAHDSVELKPGVKENCVWVQWDGSEKAHQFSKLNEGKDFKIDGVVRSKTKEQSNLQSTCPSGMPPSKQQIEAYQKLLSSQEMAHEPGVFGSVNNSYDPNRDRKIMAAIRSTEAKLAETKGKAMSSFNDNANQQHLRTGFNRSSGMTM
jgi:hypothetical protein